MEQYKVPLWIGLSSIYKFGLSVCLYPINVKTAEPIGPKFFVGHLGTPGKVYESSKFQIFVSHQNSIVIKFLKILKIREIFCENPRIIFILFYDVHKENMFRTNLEDGREAPSKASIKKWRFQCVAILKQIWLKPEINIPNICRYMVS